MMSKAPFPTRPLASYRAAAARFGQDENGSLVVFGMIILVLMVMIGGVAVDVMRYEARRTELQNTLDRSTLAAASLTQDLDPTDVVNDYFLKAGILDTLRSVQVTQGLNFRNVDASAVSDTHPLFLHLMDIEDLDAAGRSTAEQRINNVEIMLVLDVSGSMNSNSRLTNLREAAYDFIDTVLAKDTENKISIGIVPFNGQVNLGQMLSEKFNVVDQNGHEVAGKRVVTCVDLPAESYNSLAISRTEPLSETANVDTYSGSGTQSPSNSNKWCPVLSGDGNVVQMPHQDKVKLNGAIARLTGIGATSINAGMKWAVALLDPSMQGLYAELINDNEMPATLTTRPLAYRADDAMKVIVLMSDGEHFKEERVNTSAYPNNTNYKSGPSTIWKHATAGYSVFHYERVNQTSPTTVCNSRPYYVFATNSWQSRPYNGTAPGGSACYDPTKTAVDYGVPNWTWPEVWKTFNMQYVAANFYAAPLGQSTSTWTNRFRSQTQTGDMDDQLQSICTLAKEEGTLIYGIAFEAPANGQTQIKECASSVAHYFNASGLQISSAFSAIANNISQLRLTQ